MSNAIKFFCILSLVISLSGCAMSEKIRWLDERAGEFFNTAKQNENVNLIASGTKGLIDQVKEEVSKLTNEKKEKIDKFLQDNNLNRYGDAIDTVYTGGTPLFNEMTGESIDRFEYILKNHPEILEKIKTQNN